MRFDARTVSLATYFAILLFNIYTLVLYFNEQLTLYIHPRYILFTVFFNVVSLVACTIGFVLTAWRLESGTVADRVHWRPPFTALVAGLVLLAAYSLPARTLSSDTAEQRSGNFNDTQVQPSDSNAGNTLALFEVDTSGLNISDWASAFNMNASASFYEGKKVDVVGFVFHPEGTPQDVFYVSRFRITCCSVDAQPLGVPVYSPDWQEEFEEDSWVHVTGSFTETDQDIAEPAIIDPESIEPTEQPDDPYVT
jgi:putative membrane protein